MSSEEEVIDLVSSSEDASSDSEGQSTGDEKGSGNSQQLGTSSRVEENDIVDLTVSSDDDGGQGCTSGVGAYLDSADTKRMKLEVASEAEKAVHTYTKRTEVQKQIKPKNNPWPSRLSRKKSRQAKRAPVKDSRRIYHAKTMKTKFIQAYLMLPGVREGLQLLRAKQLEESKPPTPISDPRERAPTCEPKRRENEPEITRQELAEDEGGDAGEDDAPPVLWPESVTRSLRLNLKKGIELADDWPSDRCDCYGDCYADTCLNAGSRLFCGSDNCTFRGRCSNGVYETHDVELFSSGTGIGVRAVDTLPLGSTIAPYTGLLTDHDYSNDPHQYEYVVALQARARGKTNTALYIDAERWGTVARFINHSCEPNTEFVEMRHNRDVQVMVKTTREIAAGEEVTADYGETWFTHACRSTKCRDKKARDKN